MLTLDSVAANALSFLWHTVMQSWLQISSFKPCFASVAAYTLLSYGTLSCNPCFRFDLQTLFCFCCCTCTFFLMAHCHAILASDSSLKPCFDSVAANALLLCHFVVQSRLQISNPIFLLLLQMHFLSYGTLSYNPSFRFQGSNPFFACCLKFQFLFVKLELQFCCF
jgi:hypothetical protein